MSGNGNGPSQDSFLGAQIKVVTTFGEEIEGELFCCDITGSNSVILCQRLDNGNVNYKWTKANIIREVTALGAPSNSDEPLPNVDLRFIEDRAKKLEEAAFESAKRFGVGVTEHAQEVFDVLSKTMECQWDGEDIKVYGQVKVSKPYDPNRNISGGNEQMVDRVKKVLQGELGRNSKKEEATKLAPTPKKKS
eukprot:gnl/TRDRNA2_/TRDRNA2_184442_c0_seq1.p1 gnl/TRDRNA2_/TRDRNA2_184442_c0~~gnl/TRDRNA2_/TRDRNA2_184442_c0_seq1.p1  ORF type:complete len:213 (+),score=44.16 gnl/TRDRNA2_/TRDRNA2_184442_c0_seq1:65-640(+)